MILFHTFYNFYFLTRAEIFDISHHTFYVQILRALSIVGMFKSIINEDKWNFTLRVGDEAEKSESLLHAAISFFFFTAEIMTLVTKK